MNVLIVEDNANDRRLLHYTFEHHGCTVIEAKDGQEGFNLAVSHKPDIIISDALMPVMDGFQLLRALKLDEELRSIPFVFYSATYTDPNESELALSMGAEAFVVKPKEPEDLWQETCKIYGAWEARQGTPAHAVIEESEEQYLKEYCHIVATKLEKKVLELEEALTLRSKAEAEVRKLNAELEERVWERTADLQKRSRELEDSKQALMNLVEELNQKTEELKRTNASLTTEIQQRRKAQEEVTYLNEDLKLQKAALEAANRELESFSYSVSHDLRAPLRHIEGFGQALHEEYSANLDEPGQNYLRRIQKSCQQMNLLIDDLLNFSRLSRSAINPEEVSLSRLAQEIVAELRNEDPARRVQVSIAEGVMVTGDTSLLRAVMENLLGNAWKYTSKKEMAVIEFGVTTQGGKPVYFVRDNGAGFDMAYAHKLFGVFQRLHRAEEFEGTGVGLATVQRIIRRRGGKVWAEGKVGEGATFYFTLNECGIPPVDVASVCR